MTMPVRTKRKTVAKKAAPKRKRPEKPVLAQTWSRHGFPVVHDVNPKTALPFRAAYEAAEAIEAAIIAEARKHPVHVHVHHYCKCPLCWFVRLLRVIVSSKEHRDRVHASKVGA